MRVSEHIERGHTVICANVRLTHHFKHLYALEQLRQGRRAWTTPDILPWQAWLRRCWDSQRQSYDTLLSTEQESVLWQQIIEDSGYKDSLLQVSSVAGQAAVAWQRLKQYQVPVFPEGAPMNEDIAAFMSWTNEYRSWCQQRNWIDNASIADTLLLNVADIPATFDRDLVLVGFDRLTPQQTLLCGKLMDAGVCVHEYRGKNRNKSVRVADFADVDEELRSAAIWARQCLEADGGAAVGIITPDLRELRTRIRCIFEDVLLPGNLCYRNETTVLPYNISAGEVLADYPLIHVIFSLLEPGKAPLGLDTLSILLRTPFIKGYEQECAPRALLDERLHSRRQLTFSWRDLLSLSSTAGKYGHPVPVLAAMLHEIRALLEEQPEQQSPEAWVAYITRVLEVWGWPGERGLNSAEYQQLQAWHSVLDKLASLRVVEPVMPRGEALSHLRRIADGTGFQPETAETPIQVLAPQGAAVMAFDQVWMLGLNEEAWPPRPRPNPFIPISLQKQHGMPRADANTTLEQARRLQDALISATPRIILSHARIDADRMLLTSPLLQGLSVLADTMTVKPDSPTNSSSHEPALAQKAPVKAYSELIFDSRKMEYFEDTTAPPVDGHYRGGGANLFRDQSRCPFRAFARHRLHSRELAKADLGVDAMERGSLLHQLMENTWSQLHSQERLSAMTAEERGEFINSQVHRLIKGYRSSHPLIFTEQFSAIEAERLSSVLRAWLELELQRVPFEVVNVEADAKLVVGGVEFSARLDRVDVLEDGRHVIIDYKSGRTSINAWTGERPDEPQMPLYAIIHPNPVAAVAFGSLKRGKDFGFVGLAESAGILPGTGEFEQDRRATKFITHTETQADDMPLTWGELFDNWRVLLQDLAKEFRRGVASVTPKRSACDWCEQQPLCRIHEVTAAPGRQHG